MKQLIIGMGEVGQAIKEVLGSDVLTYDRDMGSAAHGIVPDADVLHICFPYTDSFVQFVQQYQRYTGAHLTIIHSTVPIGTSDKLGAVHSPVRGVHPHLAEGIRTFVKYFGGLQAMQAAAIFEQCGVPVRVLRDARNAEALKLWDTTQYGAMIMIEKEIHAFCREHGLDFEIVYADANNTYNMGYDKLGMTHVVRPALMHKNGPIGGHCVIQNARLLDAAMAKWLLKADKELREEQEPKPTCGD